MREKLFFEIPDNKEVRTNLVKSIPSDWSWVSGTLNAPNDIILSGEAQKDTGFVAEIYGRDIHPNIVGKYDCLKKEQVKPDLFAIIAERKLPGFIRFSEGEYDGNTVTRELVKRMAVSFLQKGYGGNLYLPRYRYGPKCEMVFQLWDAGKYGEETGEQPSRLKIEGYGKYRDEEEWMEPIITTCRALKLREYVPTKGGNAVAPNL